MALRRDGVKLERDMGGGPQKLDHVLSYKSDNFNQGGSDNGKETEKAQSRV